jgi:hypothetical protein
VRRIDMRASVVLAGVVLAAVAAGCAEAAGGPRYLYPPAAPCPGLDSNEPASSSPKPDASLSVMVGPLPSVLGVDFRAVSVTVCTFDVVVKESPAGGWRWRSVERSDGPVDELVRALRMPPPPKPKGELICPAMVQSPLVITLTDATGESVSPAIPASSCGFRLPEVDQALAALTWRTIGSR